MTKLTGRLAGLTGLALLLFSDLASANGAYTHIHISQLAKEQLAAGPIRTLLDDPAMMTECERGSMFPDSGYAADDPYGEFVHWEPFHDAYIQFLRTTYGGDYSSDEAKRSIAFLLGATSHGLADQVYDTTILARGFEVDGPEPKNISVDQFADYFLRIDQDVLIQTPAGGPYEQLVTVLREEMDRPDMTVEPIETGMERMEIVVRVQGTLLAEGGYLTAWQSFPWLGTHIYNDAALGSLPYLGKLVAKHWEVIWKRLHGSDVPDQHMVVATIPTDGAVNFPINSAESVAYSRVGIVFGYGVKASETFPRMLLLDASGAEIPVEHGSPYGGEDRSFLFMRPTVDLEYDSAYTVELAAGVTALGGQTTAAPFRFSFRTRCASDKLDDCPPLEPPLVTGEIPTSLPSEEEDAGVEGDDAGAAAEPVPPAAASDSGCGCGVAPRGGVYGLGWMAVLGVFWARWPPRRCWRT